MEMFKTYFKKIYTYKYICAGYGEQSPLSELSLRRYIYIIIYICAGYGEQSSLSELSLRRYI